MTATPLQKRADLLPANAWKVQARRAADGALVFDGYISAGSMADARRVAARHWPGCGIRVLQDERRPASTATRYRLLPSGEWRAEPCVGGRP